MLNLLSFLVALVTFSTAFAGVKIDINTKSFVDNHGRTLIYHGVNAVYKLPPYFPSTTGFDPSNSLSDVDAANLKAWGFNIVRLGVMWPGLEPGQRGVYDQSYLDQIETIVTNLGKCGVDVILDLHQDLWHRKFCGEGVPDYVYNTCKANEPTGTKPFPQPAVDAIYPLDSNGDPTLESCLSQMFATYYLSAEVGAGFQCLYDNVDNLWDAFAGFWQTVAKRFSKFENVLGYELLNEPWAGDVYQFPQNLLPQVVEKKFLQPLYEFAHNAIRTVDDQKIIFFEGLTIDYWPSGFTAGPGGAEYNDRQALAYHVYCPTQNSTSVIRQVACDGIDDFFFEMRKRDADRIGVGMIMTEFGAAEAVQSDLNQLIRTTAVADKLQQSWMYWQFKYYQDITTCTPQGESLYNEDGSVCYEKLDILSRTYPQAVAGTIDQYTYNYESRVFNLQYVPLSNDRFDASSERSRQTQIYVNKERTYTHGISITLMSSSDSLDLNELFLITCPPHGKNFEHSYAVLLTQEKPINDESLKVAVTIKSCSFIDSFSCTCRW